MRRIIVIPAVFIGCLIVVWLGTVAASRMPSEVLLAPTQTALAEAQSQQATIVENSSECTLSTGFPAAVRQWCPQIETAAQEVGLPAALIASVIVQESGGDPTAYSSSGAVGLMQVMPRDGLAADFMCVNGPCFASRPTIAELEDPAYNIQYGSQYLAGLVEKFGSYREALYKYGPMDMGYHYADLVLNIWGTY
ncbi:MAG: transglycosylase SLT domain-containing protein [Anaerolineaceae bacterium]|nr:transglycosylase SLT domain-containing protein [Anaerolineaceae bacterium]